MSLLLSTIYFPAFNIYFFLYPNKEDKQINSFLYSNKEDEQVISFLYPNKEDEQLKDNQEELRHKVGLRLIYYTVCEVQS